MEKQRGRITHGLIIWSPFEKDRGEGDAPPETIRYCRLCGINIDIPELDVLFEIHGVCQQTYRARGWLYEMPAYVGAA